MQKLARSTFSETDKNALLDQVKTIIDAGELRSSSDVRWNSACDRLSIRHGWHLDDWKRLGPNQMGQKCGRGWEGLRGACKRVPKGGDRASTIRESKQALAARIRKRKGLSEIADRDGQNNPGTYAFVPGKNKSSTMTARRTSPAKKGWQPPDRATRLMKKEERRALVGLGVPPGKRLKPDDTPIMDRSPKSKPKSTKGAEYLVSSTTNEAMRSHEGVRKIAEAIDFNGGVIDAGTNNRVGNFGVVKVMKLNPKSSSQRWGSATIEIDRGDGPERINVDLPTLADGVKRTSRESNPTPIAHASGAASMEKTRTRKERLQGLTDQLRSNHEENTKNSAQIYAVAQTAVSKLATEAGMSSAPQINRSKSLPSAGIPKKGAKQRIEGLLDTLKTTRDRDALNAAGIYTVAKLATSKLLGSDTQSEEAPKSRAGDRIRAIASRLKEEESIQTGATLGIIRAAGKLYDNQNKLIDEVVEVSNADLDRKSRRVKKASRSEIDSAPVQIPNQRKSTEPRRRGRSVD
jgi:hypothetical protein